MCGFAGGAYEEQKAGDRQRSVLAHGVGGHGNCFGEERNEVERAEGFEKQEHSQHETEVADTVDDEGFFPGVGGGLFQEVEADQHVAAQADAFPAYEKQNVVGGEDQDQHEEHEEIEIGEEAVVAALVGHVASGIDVDQPAYTGDDEKHYYRELINLQIETGAEGAGGDPGEELLHERDLLRRELRKFTDGFEGAGERQAGRADGDVVDELIWPFSAEQAVDGRAEQRQQRNDPEIVEYGH